jgi:3-methyladenine DNA glycosylase AlkD
LTVDAGQLADQLWAQLGDFAEPARAQAEQQYLKSTLQHLGVPVPAVRRLVRGMVQRNPVLTSDDVFDLADALWQRPVHEMRLATVELLVAAPGAVDATRLPWLEQHLRECRTWALLDTLAGTVVAELAARDRRGTLPVLDRWVLDPDMWLRRASVLGLRSLLRRDRELERFFHYAELLLPEHEFYIRKVVGWVLREVAQRHPREVSAWLREHMDRMNLVTLREPLRKLPDGAELRELYDARRNTSG